MTIRISSVWILVGAIFVLDAVLAGLGITSDTATDVARETAANVSFAAGITFAAAINLWTGGDA